MGSDDRLNQIATRVVDTLREVVREFAITEDELHAAGEFFNEMGAEGLMRALFDIAFAMTSIDATRAVAGGTRRNLEGPMYKAHAPYRPDGSLLEHAPSPQAQILTLSGVVTDATTNEPIAGAEVDIWQPDEQGIYDLEGYHLRGVVKTDANGRYVVHTIAPADYAQHESDLIGELLRRLGMSNYRAAHIHLKVWIDGIECLTTQFFRSDSPYLGSDYVVGAVSADLTIPLVPRDAQGNEVFEMTFDMAVSPPNSVGGTQAPALATSH